jgi:hypothetical protein
MPHSTLPVGQGVTGLQEISHFFLPASQVGADRQERTERSQREMDMANPSRGEIPPVELGPGTGLSGRDNAHLVVNDDAFNTWKPLTENPCLLVKSIDFVRAIP